MILLNKIRKYQQLVFATELILCDDAKSNRKIPCVFYDKGTRPMLTSRVAYRMMSSLQHSMGSKLDILPEWLDSTVRNITTASWYTSSCSGVFFPAMRTHKTLQGDCSLHRIFSSWSNKCFTSLPHRSESPNPDWCAPYPCCFNLIYFCVPRFSTYGCSLQGYCKPITSLSWARSQAPFSFQQMPSRLKKKKEEEEKKFHFMQTLCFV